MLEHIMLWIRQFIKTMLEDIMLSKYKIIMGSSIHLKSYSEQLSCEVLDGYILPTTRFEFNKK